MVVEDGTVSRANGSIHQALVPKDELSEYKLDDYDEDEKPGGLFSPLQIKFFSINRHLDQSGQGIFSNIKGLSYYADNSEDPYVTKDDVRVFG